MRCSKGGSSFLVEGPPRVQNSVRREWHFPDWELREPFDPREAMQEAKQRQIRFVDFQGRPWDDSNPQPPSVQDVASGCYTIRSLTCSFGIPTKKKQSFKSLRLDILSDSTVGLKTLQRFVGKAVSFILAVPAARLFTRECNAAIGKAIKKGGRIRIVGDLRKEIQYWAFVDDWGDDWPWKEERHVVVSIASDASGAKWGGVIQVDSPGAVIVGDMWLPHEKPWEFQARKPWPCIESRKRQGLRSSAPEWMLSWIVAQ
ncbi:Hypp2817 [Branchiostoma lanceolatum]|uniref:Hypp2817 protein n=1 Tax=Branchiostoma lanceolatum TaxID=7740 RepID=A0A8K0EVB6_BRALA|nr:Hypp2817 [Branchiostoma lanceolatum]